jgi:hypothetical protein
VALGYATANEQHGGSWTGSPVNGLDLYENTGGALMRENSISCHLQLLQYGEALLIMCAFSYMMRSIARLKQC